MRKQDTPPLNPVILAALAASTIIDRGANVAVKLPEMDPDFYREAQEVLQRLEGKYVSGRREFIFDYDPMPKLRDIQFMPKKNPYDYYPTPPEIAEQVVNFAGIDESEDDGHLDLRVLEPSAGRGALADLVVRNWRCKHDDPKLQLVEYDKLNAERLRRKGYNVHEGDFLQYAVDEQFDRIIMNPPFTQFGKQPVYMDHVMHAWDMLADGGILTAIIPDIFPEGIGNTRIVNEGNKVSKFQRFLQESAQGYDSLGKGAFRSSGTGVSTALITLIA